MRSDSSRHACSYHRIPHIDNTESPLRYRDFQSSVSMTGMVVPAGFACSWNGRSSEILCFETRISVAHNTTRGGTISLSVSNGSSYPWDVVDSTLTSHWHIHIGKGIFHDVADQLFKRLCDRADPFVSYRGEVRYSMCVSLWILLTLVVRP